MAYSALAVANAFIERAKEGKLAGLTPMKLQKLLFYTQSWHLRERELPLMDDHFARWQYGPVIPSLYHELKSYGSRPVTSLLSNLKPDVEDIVFVTPRIPESDTYAHRLIDRIINKYGKWSGTQLSNLSTRKVPPGHSGARMVPPLTGRKWRSSFTQRAATVNEELDTLN
ncbi:antitoxin SocA [Ditylenchus destructor]|nr:antitoxin SocA [Ditylenchus destructor]